MHKETRQEGGRRKEVLGEQREGEGRREEEENEKAKRVLYREKK